MLLLLLLLLLSLLLLLLLFSFSSNQPITTKIIRLIRISRLQNRVKTKNSFMKPVFFNFFPRNQIKKCVTKALFCKPRA